MKIEFSEGRSNEGENSRKVGLLVLCILRLGSDEGKSGSFLKPQLFSASPSISFGNQHMRINEAKGEPGVTKKRN